MVNEGILRGMIKTCLDRGESKEEIFDIPLVRNNSELSEAIYLNLNRRIVKKRNKKSNYPIKITFRTSHEVRKRLRDYALNQKIPTHYKLSEVVRQIINEKLKISSSLKNKDGLDSDDKVKQINSEANARKNADVSV